MPVAVALAVLAIRALALPWWEMPKPAVLDEFSYLLQADTFAAGRAANAPHPMWRHFETLFVLQRPSYASIYPPAQGLILALGEVLSGEPWWGVWLGIGLMCVAAGWMLQGWLPPKWAALGTVWIALQLGLISYWMNSYWGGAMAATGGALVLGATARMLRVIEPRHAVLLGVGLVLLANSRPYEGLVLGAMVMLRLGVKRALWPAAVIVLAGASFTMWYCWRVTGVWYRMPAQEYMRQYAASPVFIWQDSPPEPVYGHATLREAHVKLRIDRDQFESIGTGLRYTLWKLLKLGTFYLGPLLLLPPLMVYWLWRTRVRWLMVTGAVTLIAILLTVPLQPHYAAPMATVFYALSIQAVRVLWIAGRRGNPFGRLMTTASPIVAVLVLAVAFVMEPRRMLMRDRAELMDALLRAGGQHLVIVSYGSMHNSAEEWVYNRADIEGAAVVWARDLGDERNAELIRYYAQRKIWMLNADVRPPQLRVIADR